MNKILLKLKNDPEAVITENPIQNVIGQEDAKNKLAFFTMSHSEETPFPTLLLSGSQGLGKTYMSQKIADSLGRDMIEINCGSISSAKDFIEKIWLGQIFREGDKPRTLLLDEAHKLSFEVTTLLLSFLNPNEENKNTVVYEDYAIEYNFHTTNIIFATTDAHMMFKPLLNRCTEIYFNQYTNDELFKILKMYIPDINIKCSKKEISDACRGRARDAFVLTQNIKRYCVMKKSNKLEKAGWDALKKLFGIYKLGLNSQEINFLQILNKHAPVSAKNMAIKLGVNVNNIEEELEIRPRELGLIQSTSRGRCLTDAGKKYLSSI